MLMLKITVGNDHGMCPGSTMVDKIPWDTCVIALISGVFKTEF